MAQRASTFAILPAIDLRHGRVVRLEQGRFDRERAFSDDPATVAAGFRAAGARWIHVVDLEGASTGVRRETGTIATIVSTAGDGRTEEVTRVEVAGGLRDEATVEATLRAGADRVVIGTAALRDDGALRALVERHGADRVAVALDIRDGDAIGDGWVAGARAEPWSDVLRRIEDAGVGTAIVTAIVRDGLLAGPDLDLLDELADRASVPVIASGGIRSIADLQALRSAGCAGAIVGRALYDGSLDLGAAIAALSGARPPPPSPSCGRRSPSRRGATAPPRSDRGSR
jgi:phosphoribosylformimino-5-aminoimidazole carboxamide ribotide isomerase